LMLIGNAISFTELTLRYAPALILFVLCCGPARGNDLQRLYELALQRDTTLQAANSQRDAAIETRPQALAALLPQLSLNASAARDRNTYETGQIANSVDTVNCTPYAGNSMQRCFGNTRGFGLSLSQTLWSFQAFSELKEANFRAAAAESTFQAARQSLVLRVAQAYFNVLSASDQLATDRSEREAFATLLGQSKTRAETGVGPRSDTQLAQSFYDSTEQTVIDAQNALTDAYLALTQIVGAPTEALAPLRETIPLTPPDPLTVDAWVDSARQDNFDVRAAGLTAEAAERDISAQRGRSLPTLSLAGSGSKSTQDEILGGNQSAGSIGVYFTWPLIQGGAVASAVRQSRAEYRQAQALYESAQRETERRTRAAFRNIVSGIERIAAARRAVDSGRIAVEASRHNVEFGTGTEFDLLNTQNNYYVAQRAYSQVRYDYLTNVLTLKQQAGRLSEFDLAAIDGLLVSAE
jgi:outer membrane protein